MTSANARLARVPKILKWIIKILKNTTSKKKKILIQHSVVNSMIPMKIGL